MGRPCLTNHRKFRRLARTLGSEPMARGCLELLWDSCYEAGDDYLGDTCDVEAAARWSGEPGVLTKALLEAGGDGNDGFIEQSPDRPGHYHVHHLFDHAPEYVQKRMAREIERKKRGLTISDIRRSAALASHESRQSEQTAASGEQLRTLTVQTAANGETPAPAPAPAQKRSRPNGAGGTRIPEGFAATEAHRRFAAENGLPSPDSQLGGFVDYWRGVPGNRGVKMDWDATFRNWLRRSNQDQNRKGKYAKDGNRAERRQAENIAAGEQAVAILQRRMAT